MSAPPPRPPRVAAWLLSWRLPATDRDEVIGDLDEEFRERAAASEGRARRWYWRQAMALARRPPEPLRHDRPRRWPLSVDDLRYAVRRLASQPGTSAMSVITLACAIGAGVGTWSLVSAVLLRPLPLPDPDRLVVVGRRQSNSGAGAPLQNTHLYPLYPIVRNAGVFEQTAAGGQWGSLVTVDGVSTSRMMSFVTHDFFDTLGLTLQAGRGFSVTDDQPGAPPVAILSDRFWRSALHRDPDVLGKQLVVAGKSVAITGIAPAGFRGLNLNEAPDLYLPLHIAGNIVEGPNLFADPAIRMSSPTSWIQIVGRLRPGTDAAQADARLAALPAGPLTDRRTFGVTNVHRASLADSARTSLTEFARLLVITVALLLLIGCLTVGTVLLLRTEARRDEFALCLALGASRARLAAGVLCEGVLLSTAGALLAVPVSSWLLAGVRTFQLPGTIRIEQLEIPLDWRVLAIAAASAAVATLAIALVAGAFGLSARVADALRARAGVTPRLARRRTRAALVIVQLAISLVLLAGAALFGRSLAAALRLNPGYDTGRIASAPVSLGSERYSPDRESAFFEELHARLARTAGIRDVAFVRWQWGMGGGGRLQFDDEKREIPSTLDVSAVDEHYFRLLGLRVVAGRTFNAGDGPGAPRVAIVSASFGRFIARGGDPLGHRVPNQGQDQLTVVGVVPDVITNVQALEPLAMYYPMAQVSGRSSRTVVLRATGDVTAAARDATAVIRAMEPAIVRPQFTTMDNQLLRQLAPQQLGAVVLGALGGIAALLTLFGLYVLVESLSVVRRREMGVRAALGATRAELGRLMLGGTLRLVGAGIALGLVLAWAGASMIRAFLYRVQPFDAPTLAVVVAVLIALALLISLRPAMRAARADLARVLREP